MNATNVVAAGLVLLGIGTALAVGIAAHLVCAAGDALAGGGT